MDQDSDGPDCWISDSWLLWLETKLTAPAVQSWTLTNAVVVLAEARNLAALVVAVLGCWPLMRLAVVS